MKKILTALTCLLLLAGCQTAPRVETEYLTEASFANIHTYAFTQELSGQSMPAQIGPLAIKAMRTSISDRFAALGYTEAKSPQEADIVVNIRADLLRVNDDPRWSVGFGLHRDRAFYAMYNPDLDERDERTLIIDIYKNNGKSPELIWRGYTMKYLFIHSKADPEEVKWHVSEIMNHFPPTPKTK